MLALVWLIGLAGANPPDERGCPVELLSLLPIEPTAIDIDAYPAEKLYRPMTTPKGTWSPSMSGVYSYSARPQVGVPYHAGAVIAGVSFSPTCRVEVGVWTTHVISPWVPLSSVIPRVRVAILPGGLAAELIVTVPVGNPLVGGASLGLPTRYIFGPAVAFVGFEQILRVDVVRTATSSVTNQVFTALLQLGLLFQPLERLAMEVMFRPRLVWSSLGGMTTGLEGNLTITVTPLRNLDIVASSDLQHSGQQLWFISNLGLVTRF